MRTHIGIAVLISLAFCGCAGSKTYTLPAVSSQNIPNQRSILSGVVHGNFTEYAVPRSPGDFTKGPYNTLWWVTTVPFGVFPEGYTLYRFAEGTGVVTGYSKPAPWGALTSPRTLTGGRNT
jgi:hypothetical protein